MDARKKILIVEDESLTAMMMEEYITDKGFLSAGLSATGEDAILKAEAEKPDLIIMDFKLGGSLNGIQAAKIIESSRPVPIVILSGYAEAVVLEGAAGYRPRAVLRKPVDDDMIDAMLAAIA
jgi:two-component system, response regulator PdtaR